MDKNYMDNPIIDPHNELTMTKRNLPRDFFLHLFVIVTLYWSAIGFITLCWQYINYFFPDILLDQYYYGNGYSGPMKFALATLFIVFPLFIAASWVLNKLYVKELQVRESKIRKWFIYLTFFVTSLVIIGDLVWIINIFLNGEITSRFILKAFSVIAVAAIVFGYYFDDLRKTAPSKLAKIFAGIAIVVVAASVVGAFFIVGTPQSARLAQFDQRRVNDLQTIQFKVVEYWQAKEQLPPTLADLNNSISGYVAPVDPETNLPYQYTIKNAANLNFELCATFNLDGNVNNPKSVAVPPMYYGDMSQNWNHPAGYVCFDRTIDPQSYPPLNK